MTTLTALGLASLAFTAWFTWHSYHAGPNPRAAIIEAWTNIVIGFAINFVANLLILPLIGAEFTLAQNFWMGWIYTSVSILRQYAIRRWFQQRLHAAAHALATIGSTPERK
jgi:hypothetical protein